MILKIIGFVLMSFGLLSTGTQSSFDQQEMILTSWAAGAGAAILFIGAQADSSQCPADTVLIEAKP